MLDRGKRRYQVANQISAQLLTLAPGGKNRSAWECVYPRPYGEIVRSSASASHILPDLVWSVMRQESAFDPEVVSPARAVGLMQLMPETVARFGVRDPFDAEENIRAGTFYLQYLLVKYRNLPLALAAYNAGEGPVLSYGAVPPYEETTEYVARVLRLYQRYQRIPFERGAPVAIAAKAAPVKPVAAKPVAAKPAAVKLVAAGAKNTGGCALACRGDRLAAQLDELDRRLPVSPGDRDATWLAAASVARAPAN
jgi:hypothetical protein